MIASAQAAAIETVRAHDTMRLSERDARAFVTAVLSPPAPGRKLQEAVRRYRARARP